MNQLSRKEKSIFVCSIVIAIAGFVVAAVFPWICMNCAWFKVDTEDEVKRVSSVLSQLSSYGDSFGAVIALFTGLGLVGLVYTAILTTKQLEASKLQVIASNLQVEIMKNDVLQSKAALDITLSQIGEISLDQTPGIEPHMLYNSVFVKLRIANNGLATAKNCRAYLTNIYKLVDGIFQEEPYMLDPCRLRWAYEPEEEDGKDFHRGIDLPRRIAFHCDAISTKDEPQSDHSKLVMIQAASSYLRYKRLRNKMTFDSHYQIAVQVVAENSDPAIFVFYLYLKDMNKIITSLFPTSPG